MSGQPLVVETLYLLDPDTPAGIGAGAVIEGRVSCPNFQRVRGVFRQDVTGTLVLEWRLNPNSNPVYSYTVPQDTDQTDFTYGFDVIRQGRYLTYRFTNGGAPSTFLRAEIVALNA